MAGILDATIMFVQILVQVLVVAIFLRAILSFFSTPGSDNVIMRVLTEVTEPILGPLRRVIPSVGALDLSPMVAIFLLQIISSYVLIPVLQAASNTLRFGG